MKGYRILSIDGGGIRGVLPARWLLALNGAVSPFTSIARQFDLLAGTSTGAILALALACEIPLTEILVLYKDKGTAIFQASRSWMPEWTRGLFAPKYRAAGIERVLRQVFGERTLGDLKHKAMVVAYDTFEREPFVMRSWEKSFAAIPVWEAARASSAAPTFFPAHVLNMGGVLHPLIDGGVVANNPSACAVAEAQRMNGRGLPFTLVSMGTGRAAQPLTAANVLSWGALKWAPRIMEVLFDASEAVHLQMIQGLADPHRYLRFQTPLNGEYERMDRAERGHVEELDELAAGYLHGDGFRIFQDTVKALTGAERVSVP